MLGISIQYDSLLIAEIVALNSFFVTLFMYQMAGLPLHKTRKTLHESARTSY